MHSLSLLELETDHPLPQCVRNLAPPACAKPPQVWLVGVQPELGSDLISALAAARPGKDVGFFASEGDGTGFVRAHDIVAVRTRDGFKLFGAGIADAAHGPGLVGRFDETLRSAAATPPNASSREAMFVRLLRRRSAPPPSPADGSLGRSLGVLQRGRAHNPHLVRRTSEDLLDQLDGGEAGTLRALIHRTRARALAQIGRTMETPWPDLAGELSLSYHLAEDEFRQADLEREALGCRTERRIAEIQLHRDAQWRLPGMPCEDVPATAQRSAGFAAIPCIVVPLLPVEAADARDHATWFDAGAHCDAEDDLVSSAVSSTRSASMVPVISARMRPASAFLEVTVSIDEEHVALLRAPRRGPTPGRPLFVSVRQGSAHAHPPWAKILPGEAVTFVVGTEAPVPRTLEIELTVNGSASVFPIPVGKSGPR